MPVTPQVVLHDSVNLVALPIICILAFAGFWESSRDAATNPWAQSLAWAMTDYIAVDIAWVALEPRAVPSVPRIILLHHFLSLVTLWMTLRHPESALFACNWGLVEVNSVVMTLKRYPPVVERTKHSAALQFVQLGLASQSFGAQPAQYCLFVQSCMCFAFTASDFSLAQGQAAFPLQFVQLGLDSQCFGAQLAQYCTLINI